MIYFFIFLIGTVIGSFLNVVIYRLPEKKSIAKGRSKCPHCRQELKGYDLIPILSFLILKAKCRNCRKKISWQYPTVELVTGLLFLFVAYYHQLSGMLSNPEFFRDIIFVCGLLVIFMTDLKYYLIFDAVTLPLIVFAFVVNIFLMSHAGNYLDVILGLILAGFIGGGFFLVQYLASKGKWVGGGDIRIGLLMGFMLGWPKLLVALFIAYIVGAIISLFLIGFKVKKMKSQVPFGVFLSVATFVALFYGGEIINWYLNLLSV
jgi:prepilin signal peptidase PulO-like enzyme (type II secretory pathway)